MKRILFAILILLQTFGAVAATVKGNPFTRLFTPEEYGAHNRNFDILCDKKGNVYVANFEGLLYYNHAKWQIFHTPNITRIVSLKEAKDGTIVAFDFKGKPYYFDNGNMLSYEGAISAPMEEDVYAKQAYDGKGGAWSITEEGILYTSVNSPYSRFGEENGLEGEVLSMLYKDDVFYIGTTNGLYITRGNHFEHFKEIELACWQIVNFKTDKFENAVLAATAQGIFVVADGICQRVTSNNTLAVLFDGSGGCYTGEVDGVYYYTKLEPKGRMIYPMDNPSSLCIGKDGSLWIGSIYGEIICRKKGSEDFKLIAGGDDAEISSIGTIVVQDGDVYVDCTDRTYIWDIESQSLMEQSLEDGDEEHYYSHFTYTSPLGITWVSGINGKGIYAITGRKQVKDLSQWVTPFEELTIRAMATSDTHIALGGTFGVYCIERDSIGLRTIRPNLFIREFKLNDNDLEFSYSTDRVSLPGKTLYSYRLNDEDWSEYSTNTVVSIPNLDYGEYTLQVKCRDPFGIESDGTEQHKFIIPYPIYIRWYAMVCYILILIMLIYVIVRWRTEMMVKENLKLERIVEERTRELREAQNQLLRQEKLEMMGRLIQGLIDRILNPMNYIMNFSKLTLGLSKDLQDDVKDEKDNMSEDNYEDCLDIAQMIEENLFKIEEHSSNTTRILKAMEALLQEHKESKSARDIVLLVSKCYEMTKNYYAEDIDKLNVEVTFNKQVENVNVNIDAEKMSRTIMSLVANSFYAIQKKSEKTKFNPILEFSVSIQAKSVLISLKDNGVGIEESIKDKIFDPFFTTKPTADAAGVGLYICRDIVQNHGGDITMESVKGEYTIFIITLTI